MEVLIIGAGIGGLTLGLMLDRAGIACRIFEAAPELKAVGVGIISCLTRHVSCVRSVSKRRSRTWP